MADNSTLPATGDVIATDDIGGVKHQLVKLEWGPADTANQTDTASGKALPVQLRSPTGVDLTGSAGTGSAAVLTVQGNASGTAVPVSGTLTGVTTVSTVTNLSQLGGTAIAMGTGVRSSGTQRVTVATDDLVPVTGTITAVTAISNALPAGTNNIGDVDVLTLPALPAGTNNIGDVDVLTVNGVAPAFGSGVRGATVQRVTIATDDSVPVTGTLTGVTTVATVTNLAQMAGTAIAMGTGVRTAGTQRVTIATDDSVPVTIASVPSHAVTNAGTFVVQENGAALTALQLIDDTVVAQGTALGTTKNSLIAGSVSTSAPTYTTGQISPLSLDTTGALRVSGSSAGTQYTEDAAATADPVGTMLMGVRRDTLSTSEVSADGDNIALKATNKGQLHTHSSIWDGTTAAKVATASSGAPAASDPALVVTIRDVNANGSATSANSSPVVIASDQAWPVSTTGFMKKEDVASADGDAGIPAMVVRKATPANSSGTDGDYEFLQASGGYLWVHSNKGLANLAFSAAFTTLTRPANTTAYTAGDSISNNATAGSVTALSATLSDVNDDPVFISEILVDSTDTGLAGKRVRAYLFNSDPTASSGVTGGDNAAYAQKKAGYIGSFSGVMETGFSDGCVGRLVPSYNDSTASPGQAASANGFVVTKPTSSARTLYIQYQAIDAFTPSANSTTIIGTARGWQARAV